jgi:hypothetical protein
VVVVDVLGIVEVVVVDVLGAVDVVVVWPAAASGTDLDGAAPDDAAMADVDANPQSNRPKATAIVAAKRFIRNLPGTEKWS